MSSNSSVPGSGGATLHEDPKTIIGPLYIGNAINWLLLGTLAVQLYIYVNSQQRRKDPLWVQLLVSGVFLVDLFQCIMVMAEVWFFSIASWGDPKVLGAKIPWTGALTPVLDGVVSCMVQVFYAWRIWTLARRVWIRAAAAFIAVIALMQCSSSIAASTTVLIANGSTSSLERIIVSVDIWLAGSFANDIIIATCMIWLLYQARSRTVWVQSQSLYDRLIINTLQTGMITAVVAGVDLFLWVHYRQDNYHQTPAIILGKLYSNAFLSTVNGRVFRKKQLSSQDTSTGGDGSTPGVQIHVSQDRERRVEVGTPARLSLQDRRPNADNRAMDWKSTASVHRTGDERVYELSTFPSTDDLEAHVDSKFDRPVAV
ncbi:unnamed protein product [Peniophora sp. CBMAI 1063]|nr:unnamed protein product [Peniophora sp. CBMAI 1063]